MDSRFEIVGTKGRILIDNLHRQPLQVLSTAGSALGERGWSYPLPIPGLIADGHLAMLAHFVDCVRSGSPSRSDAQLGREAVQVIEAALKSASTGQRVSVHAPTGDGEAEQ
jgi:predicted dehydrogenase